MIGLFNIKNDIKELLKSEFDVVEVSMDRPPEKLDGLFIDWSNKEQHYVEQALIVQKYIKTKIPTVIFDRFQSIKYKEYMWLKKFNVFFFEPSINCRWGFDYLPQWTDIPDVEYFDDFPKERKVSLAYDGKVKDKIKSFEKYYKAFSGLYPDEIVCYNSNVEKNDYENYNLIKSDWINYNDVKFTVLISSNTEYKCGYLKNNIFDMMKCGTLPLLPIEHKYFGTLFRFLVVENEQDMYYYISLFKEEQIYPAILDLFGRIETMYPEFTIQYTFDKIKNCLIKRG